MLKRGPGAQEIFERFRFDRLYEQRKVSALNKVDDLDAGEIVTWDPLELAETIVNEYWPEVPRLYREDMVRSEPVETETEHYSETVRASQYDFEVPYDGDFAVFNINPSFMAGECERRVRHLNRPKVNGLGNGRKVVTISYLVKDIPGPDIKQSLEGDLERIELYLESLEIGIGAYKSRFRDEVFRAVNGRQEHLNKQREVQDSLGIPLKRVAPPEINAVPLERRETPVTIPDAGDPVSSDPVLGEAHYQHIPGVMKSMSVAMERSPTALRTLGEEDLRWHFVIALNGHYKSGASGETFNGEGKTDIIIDWNGKKIFIGECKFWDGSETLERTVDQLFNYTTWRDTKTAILLFNRNKNFTNVLEQIPAVVAGHGAFVERRDNNGPDSTEYRFKMRHPEDDQRTLDLTILAFDVPREG
jgi:hypothetical protein